MNSIAPFHLAFPVHDLPAARRFYGGLLGCPEGRSSSEWIDFDLFGHQIVAHLAPGKAPDHHNPVDGHDAPATVSEPEAFRLSLRAMVGPQEVDEGPVPPQFTARAHRATMQLAIEDTGNGVPPEIRARLFEPLVTSKPLGRGLGLTTARALIENQGGALRHEPRQEGGSRFVATLPRR